jgi:hypothetical protein
MCVCVFGVTNMCHWAEENFSAEFLQETIYEDHKLFMSIGLDHVSELRPPTGLLFIPHMIYKYGGLQWNDIDRETQKLR